MGNISYEVMRSALAAWILFEKSISHLAKIFTLEVREDIRRGSLARQRA
jgi:hypothetical protein